MLKHTIGCCGVYLATSAHLDGGTFVYSDDCQLDYEDAESFLSNEPCTKQDVMESILYGVDGFERTCIRQIAYKPFQGQWFVGNEALPALYALLEKYTKG